jgi:hypothetical protein
MLSALLAMIAIAALLGAALGYASIRFKVEGDPLVEKIDAILPQTQCGQCGYPGCKPYAGAIAQGEADINQCPPGGEEGIRKLADLLGREFKPLNAENVVVIDADLADAEDRVRSTTDKAAVAGHRRVEHHRRSHDALRGSATERRGSATRLRRHRRTTEKHLANQHQESPILSHWSTLPVARG